MACLFTCVSQWYTLKKMSLLNHTYRCTCKAENKLTKHSVANNRRGSKRSKSFQSVGKTTTTNGCLIVAVYILTLPFLGNKAFLRKTLRLYAFLIYLYCIDTSTLTFTFSISLKTLQTHTHTKRLQ